MSRLRETEKCALVVSERERERGGTRGRGSERERVRTYADW